MIKLSIIIPVYNSSKILKKLINEINSNLYTKLKNDYEIILVNANVDSINWNSNVLIFNIFDKLFNFKFAK